eukprot:14241670-Ditylum_brightwellii.AAC.1
MDMFLCNLPFFLQLFLAQGVVVKFMMHPHCMFLALIVLFALYKRVMKLARDRRTLAWSFALVLLLLHLALLADLVREAKIIVFELLDH